MFEQTIFLKEILAEGNDLQVKTFGFSMFPFIKFGDLITIRTLKDTQPQIGDLIIFIINDKFVLHRLTKKKYSGEYIFQTKGDCAFYFDEPINESQIIGKAVKIKRNEKIINLESKKYKILNYFLSKISFIRIFALYWILLSCIGKNPEREGI